MLKMLSTSKFFSVFVLGAITLMITVAFVFWGIGPKDNINIVYAATVEDVNIPLEQFWRVYDNKYKQVSEQYSDPEEIKKLNLEQMVLESLIDRTVLLIAAQNARLTITDRELQQAIIDTPYFQKNGVFDQNIYLRALKLNRTTPQAYESSLKSDLLIFKMSQLIGETSELSSYELKMLDSMEGDNKKQLAEIFRSSKSTQTIKAYIDSIKREMEITINPELIS
ncbi:MAG: SurA N-terminal domain-containing protein [Nitrospira sp.]|nr:SurA N-terminal domain-containing protein [Nitrospira sp.]